MFKSGAMPLFCSLVASLVFIRRKNIIRKRYILWDSCHFISSQAGLDFMSKGHMLADVVAIIGELFITFLLTLNRIYTV